MSKNNKNDKNNKNNKQPKKPMNKWAMALLTGLTLYLFYSIGQYATAPTPEDKTYQAFTQLVSEDKVDEVFINLNKPTFTYESEGKKYVTDNPKSETFKKDLLEAGVEVTELDDASNAVIGQLLSSGVSLVFLVIAFRYMMKSMGGGTKKKEHAVGITVPKVTFEQVAGQAEAKEEMNFLVDFLKNPKKYQEKGADLPKGAIFYGPPGTGKTLLAKAIAGEAKVPFFSANGSDFMEMYVGVGAKRVRALFEEARKKAPCIIFIDEIDSVGGKRGGRESNSEHNQTINALLNEMDGFTGGEGIIVIAATNRLQDLDEALIRPGRFDKHIAINLPDQTDRLQIMQVHGTNKKFAADVSLEEWSKMTTGFSGADLQALLNEAAILSVIHEHDAITYTDMDNAFYKMVMKGHKKKNQTDRKNEELTVVAWHEAGHALLAKRIQKNEVPKVTILSSTNGAGGVTFITPANNPLPSKTHMENRVKTLYAGRVAEYLLLGDENAITAGASSDIQEATKVIRAMINDYGMSEEFGMLNLSVLTGGDASSQNLLLKEAQAISKRLYVETLAFMRDNKAALQAIADVLLEKETINEEELDAILASFYPEVVGVA